MFLKISQNSHKNTCVGASFLCHLCLKACIVIKKETRALLFSCEYCKIIENIFYVEQLQATASEAALRCSYKKVLRTYQQINRRTPMAKCDLNKVANCCKFAAYFQNNLNTSEGLLLLLLKITESLSFDPTIRQSDKSQTGYWSPKKSPIALMSTFISMFPAILQNDQVVWSSSITGVLQKRLSLKIS